MFHIISLEKRMFLSINFLETYSLSEGDLCKTGLRVISDKLIIMQRFQKDCL